MALGAFSLGSASGGVVLGASIALVATLASGVSEALPYGIALGLCLLSVLALVAPSIVRAPNRFRQVNAEDLGHHSLWLVAAKWGAELGVGFRTHMVTPAFYAVVGFGLALGSRAAVVLGASYGLARAVAIIVAAVSESWREATNRRSTRRARWSFTRVARLPSIGLVAGGVAVVVGVPFVPLSG